jgi:hypothetical protein
MSFGWLVRETNGQPRSPAPDSAQLPDLEGRADRRT